MNRVALFSLVLCCLFSLQHADSAEFFGLGDYVPNWLEGYVVVSGDGEMVLAGGLGTDSMYWTRETGLRRPLDDQTHSDKTMDSAVLSRDGVVAGWVSPPLGSPNDDESIAIRWDRDNGIFSLGYLPGDDRSSATAISHDGKTILGYSWRSDDGFGERKTFLWNIDKGMQPAPELDGMYVHLSDATGKFYGISETQGFEWTAETGVQVLDVPAIIRSALSDGSTLVGFRGSIFNGHAFVWTRDSGIIEFEDLVPDWQFSAALGVSEDGSRVVGWGGAFDPPLSEGFLLTPERGVSMLGRQIGPLIDTNPNLKGWKITRAEDISDDGKVIVGRGINPQGKNELWMLSLRGGIPGDFDMSGTVTSNDIDLLHKALATDIWLGFDANIDGLVDATDAEFWVHELEDTYFGDANLDGEFNSGDLVEVFQAGEYEDKVLGNSGWAEGDWDGDGDFTTGNLVVAFEDSGYGQGPRPEMNAVPEPTSFAMLMAALIGFASVSRNRRVRV